MFLTDNQWSRVGAVVSANPGLKEIVVNKDAMGNVDVNFIGEECFQHRRFRGNVIQFPLDRMAQPKPSRAVRILDGVGDAMRGLYIDLGIILGFLEDESEEEVV